MKPLFYLAQNEIDAIPIAAVRAYADQPVIDFTTLLWTIATTATDGAGGGGSLPVGGAIGQLLVKNSATDGDAGWHDLILDGGDSNG